MFKVAEHLKELAERQLRERAGRAPDGPQRPVTTVKSRGLQGLQFRATVEGHSFISDEGEQMGGTDAGPAPLRYFLAGIMMCHQVWTVKSAALLDLQIDRIESEISGYVGASSPDLPPGFTRMTLTVAIDSPNRAEEVTRIVDEATRRCPAFVTAARGSRIDVTVEHNGQVVHEQSYGA
ncbi:MAG TPA: OsmC family protein [Chloroflexota bacterium]|nr:OsmC family protein [Chloroflexota bacterium]